MSLVLSVIIIALLEYTFFSFKVGMARGKFGIDAPAISGHPEFERYFRVQQNTLEQLMSFIPSILIFSYSAEQLGWPGYEIAAGLGTVWIIGRFIFFLAYVKDPKTRAAGFLMTFFPTMLMLIGGLICFGVYAIQ